MYVYKYMYINVYICTHTHTNRYFTACSAVRAPALERGPRAHTNTHTHAAAAAAVATRVGDNTPGPAVSNEITALHVQSKKKRGGKKEGNAITTLFLQE